MCVRLVPDGDALAVVGERDIPPSSTQANPWHGGL